MTVRGACFVSTTILPMSFDRGYTLPAATVLAIVDRTVKFIEIRLGVLARAQAGYLEHLTRRERFRLDNAPLYEALVRRSEEHTSELQSLMRISYAVFCLKTK